MIEDCMKKAHYFLSSEQETVAIGHQLADVVKQLNQAIVVYLYGDLGAGKTTLTRGFVTGMGHQGKVKSPTYTIVEPYDLTPWQVYHFDLYRLADPEELEFLGIRDYFKDNCCSFIEWPDKGAGMLAKADIHIQLRYADEQREIELIAQNEIGDKILDSLSSLR
jgi:tRNA threonylcarbamoyladenosine biosynthesis protein TsaE